MTKVHLQFLPPYTPAGAPLYLAGNFNGWQPADAACRLLPRGDGSYHAEIDTDLDLLEFKITRGHWSTAEGDAAGRERANRVFKPGAQDNDLWLRVESWTDLHPAAGDYGPAENIVLLHPEFSIPQLGRTRRIWACLPPDYWSGNRRYPVVYMQDGQNLFDHPDAQFGSWGVDQALNRLFLHRHPEAAGAPHPILIGIENGGAYRIDEYSPWPHPEHGGGQGKAYLDFVCDTLKPFVDTHLRTLDSREHTGIMGSSMGGLLALYGVLERPDVFGMAGVFSPSLWFSREIFQLALRSKPTFPARILLMAGQQESASMVSDLLDLYETLLEAGHDDHDLHYDLHSDGRHAEWFWAREFEHALHWLFGDAPGHSHGVSDEWIQFQLDEQDKHLLVTIDERLRQPQLEVRDYCHDRSFRHTLSEQINRIPYAAWEECLYAIRLLSEGDLVFSRRVHLNQLSPVSTPPIATLHRHETLLTD